MHIDGAAGCGCATCWPAHPPDHWRCACATWTPEGATRCEAESCTRRRARDDELATRRLPHQTPRRPAKSAATAWRPSMTGTSVRRAAGSLWGVRGRRQRGGGSGRGGRRAQGSPCGARGRHVWRRHAAPRSPAGRGTGRAGVRGAVVARVVFVSVVVVARPVVRHTRPTPRAADCRPAASGTPVSRSSACACAPCGDPQTSGWSLPLRWLLALRWSLPLRWLLPSG